MASVKYVQIRKGEKVTHDIIMGREPGETVVRNIAYTDANVADMAVKDFNEANALTPYSANILTIPVSTAGFSVFYCIYFEDNEFKQDVRIYTDEEAGVEPFISAKQQPTEAFTVTRYGLPEKLVQNAVGNFTYVTLNPNLLEEIRSM